MPRLPLWTLALLVVPLISFLFLGDAFEQAQLDWMRGSLSNGQLAFGVVGLLAADLFLPVPSTALGTYAGSTLSWSLAIGAVLGGLVLGNMVGFGLARLFGRPFAARFASETDLDALDKLSQRYGFVTLIVTRALPLFAEVTVLLFGLSEMTWRKLLVAIVPANLIIAVVYVSIGAWFRDSPALPIAIVASALVPLIPVLALKERWKSDGPPGNETTNSSDESEID